VTNLTQQQIDAAIETLQSSFSYDPPERWRAALETVQPLRQELRLARRPFAWLHIVALVSIVVLFAFYIYRMTVAPGAIGWATLAAMLVVPSALSGLANFLTLRQTPLLKLQGKIESVCRKFDEHLASGTPHVAS
jgi:hypothetical protein